MYLVKKLTQLLEFTVNAKINRAEKRNTKALDQFKTAKGKMQRSQNELSMAEAETLIQLKKLDDTRDNILDKAALNARRIKAIDAVIYAD